MPPGLQSHELATASLDRATHPRTDFTDKRRSSVALGTQFLSGSAGTSPSHRRASVLVLVMTLLSILFVIGVAFLATMNFEAERVAAESLHRRTQLGAEILVDDVGALVRSGLMAGSDQPLAGNDTAGSLTGFAQLPGWHNAYSPVEPYAKADGRVVWPSMVDLSAVNEPQGICLGTTPPYIGNTCSSSAECGAWSCEEVFICQEGSRSGGVCNPNVDCPGGFCDPANFVCRSSDADIAGQPCIPNLSCPAGTCSRAAFGGARWRGAELDTTWDVGAEGFEDLPGSTTPTHTWYQPQNLATCDIGLRAGESCRNPNDCCLPNGDCGGVTPQCVPIRRICIGGTTDGRTCLSSADCAGGVCSAEPVVVVDADGDGVVDSIQIEADKLGFSKEQIEQISTVVNGTSNTSGHVYVGLRVVPHGGMVNLNDAHPTLIENVLNIRSVFDDPSPTGGVPLIRPAKEQVFYAPQQEEPVLRRRNFLPSRVMPPTRLQGDPLVSEEDRRNDPYGGADMPGQLFAPKNNLFETVFEGDHRYWPTRPFEPLIPSDGDSPPLWPTRMEPFGSFAYDAFQNEYDRRHLVTTVSHEALLSRGGQTLVKGEPQDLRDLMMRANGDYEGNCDVLPFELPDYPHDIENTTKPNEEGSICQCPDLKVCSFDPRKGRLQLSLDWLDGRISRWIEDVFAGTSDGINIARQRKRLIYDYFYMLLRNAAGPEWDDVVCTVPGNCDALTERCSGDPNKPGLCVDKVLNLPRHEARATRTAASLTANLLDYMDDRVCVGGDLDGAPCLGDLDCPGGTGFCGPANAPTRVAIRSFDFSGGVCLGTTATYAGEYCRTRDDCADPLDPLDPLKSTLCSNLDPLNEIRSCAGGADDGRICDNGNPCTYPGVCVSIRGREINIDSTPNLLRRYEYVYGVEQQPFITEVATVTTTGGTSPGVVGWAVELFNPNDVDLNGAGTLELVEVDGYQAVQNRVRINESLLANRFTTYVENKPAFLMTDPPTTIGRIVDLSSDSVRNLTFKNGWIVYLVRPTQYFDPVTGGTVTVDVALDAFPITGANIGQDVLGNPIGTPPPPSVTSTLFRPVDSTSTWTAPIPLTDGEVSGATGPTPPPGVPADPQTLGTWNVHSQIGLIHPVEMRFPNTGSFTRPDPTLAFSDPNAKAVAFPTTGSMLMVMRYASHSLNDLTMPGKGSPFTPATPLMLGAQLAHTGWLNQSTVVTNPMNGSILATINARDQIDNGRMPVFDLGTLVDTNNDGTPDTQYAANHRPAWQTTTGRPGGVANLPWGQLVFDYFTALPLTNRGPFRPDPFNANAPIGEPGSKPRVDLRGLRVHGRIDLNAAPWTVLSGLPFVPLEQVPPAYRDRFRTTLFGSTAGTVVDAEAQTLGFLYQLSPPSPMFSPLAQAIVAYRESRDGSPFVNTVTTGDYRAEGVGRGFLNANPAYRRGTGFLTVGELANIRHSGAANAQYRFDTGLVTGTPSSNNFIDAISLLATLGDWATVRSDVFTLYGVIRGEADPTVGENAANPEEGELQRIEGVDARALRFQETIDRLPTFLGQRLPSRVGDRTLAPFKDVQSD